jgi:hypothetical protein
MHLADHDAGPGRLRLKHHSQPAGLIAPSLIRLLTLRPEWLAPLGLWTGLALPLLEGRRRLLRLPLFEGPWGLRDLAALLAGG